VSLEVDPGLVEDETTFKARQGGYSSINNMRPHRGGLEVVGGWEFLTTEQLTGKCRGIHSWRDNDGEINFAFGTHSGLYVFTRGKLYDITPAGFTAGNEDGFGGGGWGVGTFGSGTYGSAATGDFFPLTWTLDNYGEWLIANPRGGKIYVWKNDTASAAVAVTNAPETVQTVLCTASRQIVAYGCEEEVSGTENPRCVRWCDIEDIEDWTTSTTNNAGEFILRNAGRLVRAKEMGQIIGVWTDEGMFWQEFVGAAGATWDFRRAGSNCGLVGPNAVAILGTQAFWCGPDFVFYTVGFGGEPLALPAPVDQTFKAAQVHAQQEKIYCSSLAQFNELWWFYPHEEDGVECSRYYAFSVREGKWFSGVMDRTAMLDSAPYDYPIAVDDDGFVYIHERGITAAGDAISWHAETSDIYFQESARVVQIRGMRPDLHDQQGAVTFTLKTKQYPQGDEITHTPQTIVASQDKSDFRASGAIVRLRWESDLVGATCRLGRPVFDITQRGRR
jgi:hypothetical protein